MNEMNLSEAPALIEAKNNIKFATCYFIEGHEAMISPEMHFDPEQNRLKRFTPAIENADDIIC